MPARIEIPKEILQPLWMNPYNTVPDIVIYLKNEGIICSKDTVTKRAKEYKFPSRTSLKKEAPKYSKNQLTQELLRNVLDYDKLSGIFVWKNTLSSAIKVGDEAGSIDKNTGYINIRVYGVLYPASQLAILWVDGYLPIRDTNEIVDHNNGIRTDNTYLNLEPKTIDANNRNMALQKRNNSGHPGIRITEAGTYAVRISVDSKVKTLGTYTTYEKALQVRKNAEKKYGYHENHGRAR